MKVYCENCKWYRYDWDFHSDYCLKIKGWYRTPISNSRVYADCYKDNRNNNCPYYEKKESLLKRIKTWLNWKK